MSTSQRSPLQEGLRPHLPVVGLSSQAIQRVRTISCMAQGALYIVASVFHFTSEKELAIIPPFLPWRRAALYLTGLFEFLGGLGLLLPRFQRLASWGLAVLLVTIWPANLYHAFLDQRSSRWQKTRLYHILRSPLQVVLIVWVLWAGNRRAGR